LQEGIVYEPDPDSLPASLTSIRRACFVSLHGPEDQLRGCVGTLEPQEENLTYEIRRNALSAAFHDNRFEPLQNSELEDISISVDVLTPAERIYSANDLDPAIFGLIITDGQFKRGVLLPSVPTIDTVEKQIAVVKRKAGLADADDRKLEYYRFTSTRHH
jgi:AmmeMemoRadiSam system protein A